MHRITGVLRDSVFGYLTDQTPDNKVLYFNKLVAICTSNTIGLSIPCRTVGFGLREEKIIRDSPIKDLAEEFVLEHLNCWLDQSVKGIKIAINLGRFDFMPNRFKSRVLNKIRDIKRSHEEDCIEMLPEDDPNDPYDECK
jgi:hypothetical protein